MPLIAQHDDPTFLHDTGLSWKPKGIMALLVLNDDVATIAELEAHASCGTYHAYRRPGAPRRGVYPARVS